MLVGFNLKAFTWLSSGQYDISWYNNSESEFTISTPKQFAGIAYLVNNGYTTFYNKTIKLSSIIDLSANTWVPIGDSDGRFCFKGSLDGQGYVIKGVDITLDVGIYPYYGLFTRLADAKISNIKIEGKVNLQYGEDSYKVDTYVGLLAAYATNCTFTNLFASLSFTYNRLRTQGAYLYDISAGSFVGKSSACSFIDCSVSGNFILELGVTGSTNANHNGGTIRFGGLTGETLGGTFKRCVFINGAFETSLSASKEHKDIYSYIGGIVGSINSDTKIEACGANVTSFKAWLPRSTYGGVGSPKFSIGGIAASSTFRYGSGHIYNCYSSCNKVINMGQAVKFGGIVGSSDYENSADSYKANFSASDVTYNDASYIIGYDAHDGSTSFSSKEISSGTSAFMNELRLYPSLNNLNYYWDYRLGIPTANEYGIEYPEPDYTPRDVEFVDYFGGYHFIFGEKSRVEIDPIPSSAQLYGSKISFDLEPEVTPKTRTLSTGRLRVEWFSKSIGKFSLTYSDESVSKTAYYESHPKNEIGVPDVQYSEIEVGQVLKIYPTGLTPNSLLDLSEVTVDKPNILSAEPVSWGNYTTSLKITGLKEGKATVSFLDGFSNAHGKIEINVKASGAGVENISSKEVTVSTHNGTIFLSKQMYVSLYNIGGTLIYKGETKQINNLATGIYVLLNGTNAHKIMVK